MTQRAPPRASPTSPPRRPRLLPRPQPLARAPGSSIAPPPARRPRSAPPARALGSWPERQSDPQQWTPSPAAAPPLLVARFRLRRAPHLPPPAAPGPSPTASAGLGAGPPVPPAGRPAAWPSRPWLLRALGQRFPRVALPLLGLRGRSSAPPSIDGVLRPCPEALRQILRPGPRPPTRPPRPPRARLPAGPERRPLPL